MVLAFPANVKDIDAAALYIELQYIARATHQMRYIDHRKRIGTFDDQTSAAFEPAEQLAGAQNRQRTFQAAQIKMLIDRHEIF